MTTRETTGKEPESTNPETVSRPAMRRTGLRLLRRMILYHLSLFLVLTLLVLLVPSTIEILPVGGIESLAESGDVRVGNPGAGASADQEIVTTVLRATGELDRLGYARRLAIMLVGTLLLMLPVSWVHKSIYRATAYDHSLDETTLILPGVVAAIVLVVQHSLALAFSLAGIVAGVQFRRALQDTFDALFILVAIGVGIAAGVEALEIAAVLTVFFSYATLYVCCFGDGLESDFLARRKAEKRRRKQVDAAAAAGETTGDEAPRQ